MKPAARVQAAIDVLAEIVGRQRPAAAAMADWGRSHRFAGSGDRAAIGDLVFAALRRRASAACLMQDDAPRALVLGALALGGMPAADIAALADDSRHGPGQLTEAERAALAGHLPPDAPDHVLGDFPGWLASSLSRAFGPDVVEQMRGLARRAPLDLRTNTLVASRDDALAALAAHAPVPTSLSPLGIRIEAKGSARFPNVESTPEFAQGWFEVQDEGSQLAALLTGARPGMTVADVCAGAGGKTLALAAMMQKAGTLHAYDADARRLSAIHARIARSGATNITVLPAGTPSALNSLTGTCDVVLVDAPCTGAGTWRRTPDTKWLLTPDVLATRVAQQRAVLDMAAPLVRPGGRLVYVTCSILPEENVDQANAFLDRQLGFAGVDIADVRASTLRTSPPPSASTSKSTLQLTPRTHGTDGFFVAVMERR